MTPSPALDAPADPLADTVMDSIRALIGGRTRYGLLDFPSHRNIGDSAIWLGEVQALHWLHGGPPAYASHHRFAPGEAGRILPDGLIYLHGGGNFGDIWPHHQFYREAVIAANPGQRIIQLPQSLHFGRPEAIERTRRVIGGHPDFHLMVRDHESLDFARRHFDCPVYLVPDSAYCIEMGQVPRNARPAGIMGLLRDDKERRPDAEAGARMFGDARIEDWARFGGAWAGVERLAMAASMLVPRLPGLGGLAGAPREAAFTRMARDRVMLGFAQLDAAEVVVTDRLHGHIMASLLGKPHVVIDNFYGKITNFIRAWGARDTLQARDYAEAAELAQTLLAQHRQAPPRPI
jgi:pyruvyl transferase EpsO